MGDCRLNNFLGYDNTFLFKIVTSNKDGYSIDNVSVVLDDDKSTMYYKKTSKKWRYNSSYVHFKKQ